MFVFTSEIFLFCCKNTVEEVQAFYLDIQEKLAHQFFSFGCQLFIRIVKYLFHCSYITIQSIVLVRKCGNTAVFLCKEITINSMVSMAQPGAKTLGVFLHHHENDSKNMPKLFGNSWTHSVIGGAYPRGHTNLATRICALAQNHNSYWSNLRVCPIVFVLFGHEEQELYKELESPQNINRLLYFLFIFLTFIS